MKRLKSRIWNLDFQRAGIRLAALIPIATFALIAVALLATDALARVGGGQSYGGGRSGGSGGDGGGAGALVYLLVRFLLWLTIEHPVIGIPLDIIVIALVIYWFAKPSKRKVELSSSSILGAPDAVTTAMQQQNW